MYTCVCNAIRETTLREAALRHPGDAQAVYAMLGKRPNCGQCLEEADAILAEVRDPACCPAMAA